MPTPAPKNILIVEDETDIAGLIKLYMEKEGYHTALATRGMEGLKSLSSERPDMMILDLMLPEMDGLELCKKIRNKLETAMLPIIMGTAKAEEFDASVGIELGVDDYITKPFSPKALAARVTALFHRLERIDEQKPSSFSLRVPEHVAVFELTGVLWSDWGKPERIAKTHRQIGRQPVFPLECLGSPFTPISILRGGDSMTVQA